MSHESEPLPPRPVLKPDGTPDGEYLHETWGISADFAMHEVTFDTGDRVFQGTVASMLADTGCPVGGRAALMYQKGSIEGVSQYFEGMVTLMGAEFTDGFVPSVESIASEEVKKNRQIFPTP